MSENITTTVKPDPWDEQKAYRPKASMATVHQQIERSLRDIVWEATHQAERFISSTWDGQGESIAARYRHVMDAHECLELALVHLDKLKAELAARLRLECPSSEYDEDGGILPF